MAFSDALVYGKRCTKRLRVPSYHRAVRRTFSDALVYGTRHTKRPRAGTAGGPALPTVARPAQVFRGRCAGFSWFATRGSCCRKLVPAFSPRPRDARALLSGSWANTPPRAPISTYSRPLSYLTTRRVSEFRVCFSNWLGSAMSLQHYAKLPCATRTYYCTEAAIYTPAPWTPVFTFHDVMRWL